MARLIRNPLNLILLVSVYLLGSANHSFFSALLNIYPWSENQLFVLSVGVMVLALQCFIVALLALVLPLRFVLALLLLIAAPVSFFADQYGVIVNDEMLRNVIETNPAESADLMNVGLIVRLLVFGLLPAALVLLVPLEPKRWWVQRLQMAGVGLGALLVMAICIGSASSQYASFFREHKPVRYLLNPGYPLYSAILFSSERWFVAEAKPFEELPTDARVIAGFGHHELVIMVVGETLRSDHLGLNGYERDTTPLMAQQERLLNFSNVSSCGTSTAISVPCMFSYLGHDNIDVKEARNSENVLDLLAESGVKVLWRDNNSDSKGVADRVTFEDFRRPETNPVCDEECRDVGMLAGLQEYIDTTPGDKLIVLHQMGNHGPAYYKRYPASFERFTPVCRTNELAECSQQEVINAYDNAVAYTDYFLNEVITLLKNNSAEYETNMLFVSDHGESLGENGVYLHGLPYSFAPEAQTHVPIMAWVGPHDDIDFEASKANQAQPYSHDVVFDTLLGMFEEQIELPSKAKNPLLHFRMD
ncbi:phosphoethanolamine--lipid A transferase [Spongiibacter sp. KMU-158]|uniref:Phosphoethanolamine--lipid A transferase n=1 Tax=Spongiibacter pelagi TaxID=2760804 RepID=A0A927C0V9_9GAMM|nr:phosphoethanolamine--lipid A transferase [Spongiibacter pelagi]MBD2857500.1 phosphoethanolamine--lipid A transferase [Spongiibacter pelagi]